MDELELKPPSLAERCRPQTWGAVCGYTNEIGFLRDEAALTKSANADRPGGRSVLFSPAGVGKTVLGELYGRALHCSAPGGDPCRACWDCDQWRTRSHLNLRILNGAFGNTASFASDVNEAIDSTFDGNGRLVVLIDEAELLAPQAWSLLHDRIERPPSDVTFIVCAGRPLDLATRHRELLREVRLNGLSMTARQRMLRNAAENEGLVIEPPALQLLARLGGERPRALLNHLEALALRGSVTADDVRAHFHDPRTEKALAYFERVLARASLADQIAALRDEAGLPLEEVGALVRGTLTSMLGTPALGLPDEGLPFAFDAARSRADLASGLLDRRTDKGLSSQQMFSRLIAWWSTPIADESELIARINDFDEWLNGPARMVELDTAIGFRTVDRRRRPKDELQVLEAGRGGVASARRQALSADYLSRTDVQRIWDAASFLIQKHGLYLNGRLSLCWGPGGQEDEAEIAGAIFGLQHELRQWALRQEKARTEADMKFHRVRIHARDAEGERWTHWGLASRHNLDVGGWVEGYRGRSTKPLAIATKVEWEPGPRSGQSALDRHHEVLAYLLAGIEPGWRVQAQDELGRTTDIPVAELLGVRTQRAAGKRFMKSRTAVSRYIDREYRSRASAILPPLSLFDEQVWDSALSGWEVAEHDYRTQCELEYERRVMNFRRDWPPDDAATKELRAVERSRLEEQWASEESFRIARRPGISRIPKTTEMNIEDPASKVAGPAINNKKKTKKQM